MLSLRKFYMSGIVVIIKVLHVRYCCLYESFSCHVVLSIRKFYMSGRVVIKKVSHVM